MVCLFPEEKDDSNEYNTGFTETFPDTFPNLHSIFEQEKQNTEQQDFTEERQEELRNEGFTQNDRLNDTNLKKSKVLTEKRTLQGNNSGGTLSIGDSEGTGDLVKVESEESSKVADTKLKEGADEDNDPEWLPNPNEPGVKGGKYFQLYVNFQFSTSKDIYM